MTRRMLGRTALAVLFVVLLVSSGAFAVDVSSGRALEPVPFDNTLTMGLTSRASYATEHAGHVVPRAEVFYAQYRYVVGYEGLTALVDDLGREGHARQFGRPLAIYVTDFAGSGVGLTDEGFLHVDGDPERLPWVAADQAHFVVESRARTGGGPAVVPFSSRSAARSFVAAHGGRVVDWESLRAMSFGTSERSREALAQARVERDAWADRTVAAARELLDRPVSVVVGEDAPTVQAAVDRAPPNTTVLVPAGRYDGTVTIDKPLTLRGVGNATRLVGDGTGSVLRVLAPRVAVADLAIAGVGNTTSVSELPGNQSKEEWDYRVKLGYAYGDAGVELDTAPGSLVHGVHVTTPANGVVVRWSDGTVVDDVSVVGPTPWWAGFMGVMDMESRIVVQDSTFRGGRDAVYTHDAPGTVVRDNDMADLRFGVHLMYTSGTLLANNTVDNASAGLIVMTRPTGNVIVDNRVTASGMGVSVVGSDSYVAGNVVVGNRYGLYVSTQHSHYLRNVVAYNEVGARAGALFPTNRVVDNDFVGNHRHALASLGPLRIWTGDGRGNYWAGVPGFDRDGDGLLDRAVRPTGPVDGIAHRAPGAATMARSPAVMALRGLQDLLPGLRATGVADTAPLADPVRPDVLERLNATRSGSDEEKRDDS